MNLDAGTWGFEPALQSVHRVRTDVTLWAL